jgi:ABC-2 type transport system ATP-binding protein
MSDPVIELRSVSKRFAARVALADFTLGVAPGAVIGVLGPNGAGKTTVIGLVAGLSRPTSGEVHWRGKPLRSPFPADVRRAIGSVAQETALYDELTVQQNLRFAAELFGVRDARRRTTEVLELVGLRERERDRAGELSGGMRRRVALGRALLHEPSMLILDEPTLGVDVEARHLLWAHIRMLRRSGKAVLITTNHLDEAEALCDHVVVLREGRQVAAGDPAELLARTGRCVEIDCIDGSSSELYERLRGMTGVTRVARNDVTITVHLGRGAGAQEVADVALASDLAASVRVRAPDLIEVFQSLAETSDA